MKMIFFNTDFLNFFLKIIRGVFINLDIQCFYLLFIYFNLFSDCAKMTLKIILN